MRKPDPRLGLVLGGARSVWKDLAALERMIGRAWPGVVLAVNDVGCRWVRPLHYWVTLHPDKFTSPNGWRNPDNGGPHGWCALRRLRGYPEPETLWSHIARNKNAPAHRKQINTWGGGSSGLLGPAVLYREGCQKIVLVGLRLDASPHFDQSTVHKKGRSWASYESHRRPWKKNQERLRERTRAMSGWTRDELLGPPDLDWLFDLSAAA